MEGTGHRVSGNRKKWGRTKVERKEPQGSEGPVLNIGGGRVALGPLLADLLPLYERWINDFGTIRMLGLPLKR